MMLFLESGYINGVTSVQVNVLSYSAERENCTVIRFEDGIGIDIFKRDRWPNNGNITYITIPLSKNLFAKILQTSPLLRAWYRSRKVKGYLNKSQVLYAFGEEAGRIAMMLKKYYNCKYVLHSIELNYDDTSIVTRKAFHNALFVVTQDQQRRDQLIKLYHLQKQKLRVSINSLRASANVSVDTLPLPDQMQNKIKLLFVGSLIDEHYIGEVIDACADIPNDVAVIFHGWGLNNVNKQKLDAVVKAKPRNVYKTEIELTEDDKFKIYNTIDIGLVFFSPRFRNNLNGGISAGKLFDFMKVGKPVICNNIPLMAELVETTQIGIVITNIGSLFTAAKDVFKNYTYFSSNSEREFWNWEFDKWFTPVYEEVKTINSSEASRCNTF